MKCTVTITRSNKLKPIDIISKCHPKPIGIIVFGCYGKLRPYLSAKDGRYGYIRHQGPDMFDQSDKDAMPDLDTDQLSALLQSHDYIVIELEEHQANTDPSWYRKDIEALDRSGAKSIVGFCIKDVEPTDGDNLEGDSYFTRISYSIAKELCKNPPDPNEFDLYFEVTKN